MCVWEGGGDWNHSEPQFLKWEKEDGEWKELRVYIILQFFVSFLVSGAPFENMQLRYSSSYNDK